MNMIFETVLKVNKQYDEAMAANARKEVLENLHMHCEILMKTMIIDAGLLNEYSEYCKTKNFK